MHSPAGENPKLRDELAVLDILIADVGLVRSLHRAPAWATRPTVFNRAEPQELRNPAPAPRMAANGVQWLAAPAFGKLPWLWHGFSTRRGGLSRAYCAEDAPGELNLGFMAEDDRETVLRNRQLWAEAVTGRSATPLVTLRQFHSNLVVQVAQAAAPDAARPRKADGLMTAQPGLLLGVLTADCIPVLVADPKRRAVAAFHAGWRGTVQRIVESGIGRMRLEFGSRPEDLIAAIGPGIGACCYPVGEEVLSSFESQFTYARELFVEVYDADPVRARYPMLFLTQRVPGHLALGPRLHLNVAEANRRQLLAAGLKPRSIHTVGGCTNCQPELFFSHRGSQGRAGRMMAAIGVREVALT